MDFSVILQAPEIRSIVQDNLLERAFHDALVPRLLFRGEATPVPFPAGVGDTQIFSAPGLMSVDARPLLPGQDPDADTYTMEQWTAQINQYSKAIDTHMPTSMVAIANLFLRNSHQLGVQAAMTLNRVARNRMFNAALSGWSVVDGAQTTTTTLRVKRINGFTRARNPNLAGGSAVRFDFVSSTNPLAVTILNSVSVATPNTVIGYTPDTPGDEVGTGTLTLGTAITVNDRAYIFSADATQLVRVGGGNSIDALVPGTTIPHLADVRTAVSKFQQANVPEHPDGRFHAHLDPTSMALIFQDNEFQRLLTALPDYYMYKQFTLGELLGCVFFRNSENPVPETVVGGLTATFDQRDPFPGELNIGGTSSGGRVHRILFTAQGGIMEYYSDLMQLLTEAGITGKTADTYVVNNGIEIFSERIQLVIRAPLNRLQDTVSTAWKFIGDWPVRTDAATGNTSRYKRFIAIEHSE